jgi:uncharacterized protein
MADVAAITENDAAELRAFLAKDPVNNMYLGGLIQDFGLVHKTAFAPFEVWANRAGGKIDSVVFVGGAGGLVVPSVCSERGVEALGKALSQQVELKSCIGDARVVERLCVHLCKKKPRLNQMHRVFSVSADDLGPFTNPHLRAARIDDADGVVKLAAAEVKETVGEDPLRLDADAFRERVIERIEGVRTYIIEERGNVLFKVDVGSRSELGAELEGIFTHPGQRRKGLATLCLGQISRYLLSSLPRLIVRVDERNPLARAARKVGYVPKGVHRRVMV